MKRRNFRITAPVMFPGHTGIGSVGRRLVMSTAWATLACIALGSVLSPPAQAQSTEDTVVFAAFGGSIQQIMQTHVLPGFTKQTGIKVVYLAGSADKTFAQVQASASRPDIDVLWSNPTTHLRAKQLKLLEKIDPAQVPNAASVFPKFRDPDEIGIGMGVNVFGLTYNRKIIAEKKIPIPGSWDDLWHPSYKGHVALYNIDLAFTSFWLPALAKSMGTSTDKMDSVFSRLATLKPNLVAIPTNTAEMSTLFQQGAVWLAVNTNARTYQMRDEGMDVEWVAPKEGAVEFMNYLDPVKNAPHPKAAQALINYLLSPQAQKVLAEKMYFGPVIKDLALGEKLARETYYSPGATKLLVPIDAADLAQKIPSWTRRWNAEVAR